MIRILSLLVLMLFTQSLSAQQGSDAQKQLDLLKEFLSIPNDANYPENIDKNIDWLSKHFSELGFATDVLETEALPLFFAEYKVNESLPTVLFYMHFDGQPVDNSSWDQEDGYHPVIKKQSDSGEWIEIGMNESKKLDPEFRIFGRSASDDKGPIAMFISAFNRLKDQGKKPAFNIKVILDSMEEQGSPVLAPAVIKYKDELSSDYLAVFDGPMHDGNKPTLLFGVRGITTLTMEVYGPSKPQHSGHFGNYAPNPVFRASELLASMKDENGKVIVNGWYEGIDLDENTLKLLSEIPMDEEAVQRRAGFANPEQVGNNYQESMQFPSLNVRGIKSGWVGNESRTIVPDKVIIEMDIRTVPESDSEVLIEKLKKHIEKQGFTILDHQPNTEEMLTIDKPLYFEYSPRMFAFRTDIDSKIGDWLRASVQKVSNEEIVQIRISGGSVPLSFFINELDIPAVLVPLVNPDNNQHSPNENLRLGNYFNGIKIIESVLTTGINK